jgi:hypothetical protein
MLQRLWLVLLPPKYPPEQGRVALTGFLRLRYQAARELTQQWLWLFA